MVVGALSVERRGDKNGPSARDSDAVLAGALNLWNTSVANRLVRNKVTLP